MTNVVMFNSKSRRPLEPCPNPDCKNKDIESRYGNGEAYCFCYNCGMSGPVFNYEYDLENRNKYIDKSENGWNNLPREHRDSDYYND